MKQEKDASQTARKALVRDIKMLLSLTGDSSPSIYYVSQYTQKRQNAQILDTKSSIIQLFLSDGRIFEQYFLFFRSEALHRTTFPIVS
ncbi:MAG: hypothetical protein Q4G38_03675 [Aeriscardovia aeriphila]|nr:hypothetical protein [Aeriscardovia aeriphila]